MKCRVSEVQPFITNDNENHPVVSFSFPHLTNVGLFAGGLIFGFVFKIISKNHNYGGR